MPCTVEDHKPDLFWFCCNCGDGPMPCRISSACTACNDHVRCGYMIRPPDSPRTHLTRSLTSYKRAQGINSPASVDLAETSNASLFIQERLGHHETTSGHSFDSASGVSPFYELPSLQTAFERLTQTIVSALFGPTSTPEAKHCPNGGGAPPRTQKGPIHESSHQHSDKKQRQRNGKRKSSDQGDEQESGEDSVDDLKHLTNSQDQPSREFACPFCKINPHRYRHEESCKHGWLTYSELR
jgi:hypothetical protein